MITILANKSSSICLMLFHIHVYINFINAIETIKIKLYVNKKHIKKYSISSSTCGTPSFPNNTLKVFNPHTTVPYTPAYIHKEKICKIDTKMPKMVQSMKMKATDTSFSNCSKYNLLSLTILDNSEH